MVAISIFCGSSAGTNPIYLETAQYVGQVLASQNITLVYGGGKVGLMGAVADSALAHGGQVIGVIPQHLVDRELAHTGLTELHIVHSMHERKQKMDDLSDAFIALPGGAGTLDEIFEQWTWAQLGIHQKPCAFLDVAGYYQPLFNMVTHMVEQGFTKPNYAEMLIQADNIETILTAIQAYHAPQPKWQSS